MPFKSKAQAKYMFAKHPAIAKEFAAKTPSIKSLPEHHSGKGTRARLENVAEKMMFNSKRSK
jgi:hypothetical protein